MARTPHREIATGVIRRHSTSQQLPTSFIVGGAICAAALEIETVDAAHIVIVGGGIVGNGYNFDASGSEPVYI
jgi:hypothetical protein